MEDLIKPKVRTSVINQMGMRLGPGEKKQHLLACGGFTSEVEKFIRIGMGGDNFNIIEGKIYISFDNKYKYNIGKKIPAYNIKEKITKEYITTSYNFEEKSSCYFKIKDVPSTLDYNFLYIKRNPQSRYLSKILVEYRGNIYLMKLKSFFVESPAPYNHAMGVTIKYSDIEPTKYLLYDDNNALMNRELIKLKTTKTDIKLVIQSKTPDDKIVIENSEVLVFSPYVPIGYPDYIIDLQYTNEATGMFYVVEKIVHKGEMNIIDCVIPFDFKYKKNFLIEQQIKMLSTRNTKAWTETGGIKSIYEEIKQFFKLTKTALVEWQNHLMKLLDKKKISRTVNTNSRVLLNKDSSSSETTGNIFYNIFKYNIDIISLVIYCYEMPIVKERNSIEKSSSSISFSNTKSLNLDDEYKLYVKDYLLSIAKEEFILCNDEELILKELFL